MPASRRLTLILALLGLPDLAAAAAPRANAPAAPAPSARPVGSPGPARAAAATPPVPRASRPAPAPADRTTRTVRPPPADAVHPSRRAAQPVPEASHNDPAWVHPSRRNDPRWVHPSRRAVQPAPKASRNDAPVHPSRAVQPAPKASRNDAPVHPSRAAQPAPKASRNAANVHPSRAAQPAPKASHTDAANVHPSRHNDPTWVHPSRRTDARRPARADATVDPSRAAQPNSPAIHPSRAAQANTRAAQSDTATTPPDVRPVHPSRLPKPPATPMTPQAADPAAQPDPKTRPADPAAQPDPKTRPADPAATPHDAAPLVADDAQAPPAPQPAARTPEPAAEPAPKASPPPPAQPAPKASPSPTAARPAPTPTTALAAPTTRTTRAAATKPTRLRPKRDPLLARHPAASCTLDPLEAVAQRQHERTRGSLREFYWSDMARFFETTFDESEPSPRQADDAAFVPAADVLATLPQTARAPLTALAGARLVDRLSEKAWIKTNKLLSSLSPADVAALLRADSPTLRAHVWTWLATTKTGGCHLGHVDLDFIEAAVADRSIAVEHGEDLVYRSLGDYALEARARLATLDPARFDAFLARLTGAAEVDPLVRATAHGILLRRAHWDTLELGLRDPSPPVRAATAAAAAEMNTAKLEARLIEHAAADPADLVTELVVGSLLGVHDPHNHGKPQLRGLLATTRDERLTAAVDRWRGRGDALAPLPVPAKPLRFAAAPVPTDSPAEPVPTDSPRPQAISGASPAAAAAIHDAAHAAHAAPTTRTPEPRERPLPGVRDGDTQIKIPPVRP